MAPPSRPAAGLGAPASRSAQNGTIRVDCELPGGNILLKLKRPLGNGTAAIELTPIALLRRLASLVPAPGSHDTCYFGIFAANAKWRRRLVRPRRKDPEDCHTHPGCEIDQEQIATMPDPIDPLFGREDLLGGEEQRDAYIPWAQLMKRVFGLDMLQCPCGGKRKVRSYVTTPEKLREGLERLGLWSQAPKVAKARRPAQEQMFDRTPDSDGVDPPTPDFAA